MHPRSSAHAVNQDIPRLACTQILLGPSFPSISIHDRENAPVVVSAASRNISQRSKLTFVEEANDITAHPSRHCLGHSHCALHYCRYSDRLWRCHTPCNPQSDRLSHCVVGAAVRSFHVRRGVYTQETGGKRWSARYSSISLQRRNQHV